MITFRQHIDISKAVKKDNSVFDYIETLEASKKVQLTRDVVKTYPIKTTELNNLSLNSKFNYTTEVMNMVLGQFIMTEQIITGKTKYSTDAENDLALAELILRPPHHNEFDNENKEDEDKNRNNILDCNVTEVYSVLHKYFEVRELVLFKQFAGVFYETPDEDQDDDDVDEDTKGNDELFQQQWYWYSMVRLLAKEDVTKYGEIYMLKMSTVMPEMSYLAQKSKIESANQRQHAALRKL